jgi:hypothetical protein
MPSTPLVLWYIPAINMASCVVHERRMLPKDVAVAISMIQQAITQVYGWIW